MANVEDTRNAAAKRYQIYFILNSNLDIKRLCTRKTMKNGVIFSHATIRLLILNDSSAIILELSNGTRYMPIQITV